MRRPGPGRAATSQSNTREYIPHQLHNDPVRVEGAYRRFSVMSRPLAFDRWPPPRT